MEANYYAGIDISKKRLDWQVNELGNHQQAMGKTPNSPDGITRLLSEWAAQGIDPKEVVICFEHTGSYGLLLAAMLEEAGVRYVQVAAAQVQRSLGIRRGKSDGIDAGRLAEYGWRFRDRLSPSRLPSGELLELRSWLVWREKLIKMRTSLTNTIKTNELVGQVINLEEIRVQMEFEQAQITNRLRQVDRKIQDLLREYNKRWGQYELLVSIPGIGPVIAGWLLVYTEGFSRFDNGRQMACFIGSAPFPHQSGQHQSPDRVSQWRCQRLKTLLLNGVHSSIRYDPELRNYYRRKCAEGKHPQSVRNAVTCKLLYRVFTVIHRGTPYVKLYQHERTTIS